MLLRLHKKQKKGRLEVDPAKRLRDPKLFLEAFATDQWSYGNTLPTESQRYSGNGVLLFERGERRRDVSSGIRITTSAMSQDGGYVRSTQ